MRVLPTFAFEIPLWKKQFSVIGIDEVGRGAFAGPVGVGGVIFDSNLNTRDRKYLLSLGIDDSKKLTPSKRKSLASIIKETVVGYAVELIDVAVIDNIGIGKATFIGMKKVAEKLSKTTKNPHLLIDAFEIPNMQLPQHSIIRGDSLSISIAAASILAKVERDIVMEQLALEFKNYDWENNKGYGTLKHRKAISEFGVTKFHRKQFCRNFTA